MDIGFETIGNATVVVHDDGPVLATDPWVRGSAYFGSWGLSHEIPPDLDASILAAGAVSLLFQPIVLAYVSHGFYVKSADSTWSYTWEDGGSMTLPISFGIGYI